MRPLCIASIFAAAVACSAQNGSPGDVAGTPGEDASVPPGPDASGPVDSGAPDGDASAPPPDAVTPPPDAGPPPPLDVIVEPGDDAAALIAAINAATKSVHMTMYLLDDSRIITALVHQHNLGHEVKVVLNQSFPTGGNANQSAHDTLVGYSIPVVYAPSAFTLTHEKCVILDGATAWIMTMNLATSAPKMNREYLVIDNQEADVSEAEAIFAADFANQSITASGPLLVAPDNAQTQLVALAKSAKKTIDVEGEELSDSQFVTALANAQKAGATVRVVLSNATPSSAQNNAVSQLKTAGVKVVQLATPYVHAKAMVVDGARAYVGSANFTSASFNQNRELGIITGDALVLGKVSPTIAADFTAGAPL